MYICVISNTTELIGVELVPNLMLPDQNTIPTSDEADRLQTALFSTNSKFMEIINLQYEFEKSEEKGFEASECDPGKLEDRREAEVPHVRGGVHNSTGVPGAVPDLAEVHKQNEDKVERSWIISFLIRSFVVHHKDNWFSSNNIIHNVYHIEQAAEHRVRPRRRPEEEKGGLCAFMGNVGAYRNPATTKKPRKTGPTPLFTGLNTRRNTRTGRSRERSGGPAAGTLARGTITRRQASASRSTKISTSTREAGSTA